MLITDGLLSYKGMRCLILITVGVDQPPEVLVFCGKKDEIFEAPSLMDAAWASRRIPRGTDSLPN